MKRVRIASGAGFGGDRIEPALEIISNAAADYIIFECLAERTIALAQKRRMENSELGYNALLNYRMEKVIPLLKEHPIKIITNMGAANPKNAAKQIYEILVRNEMEKLKIAVVEGDDVMDILEQFSEAERLKMKSRGYPFP